MRVLIVYESMFGNTEKVAQAIAAVLTPPARVDIVEVGAAPPTVAGIDLLIVGAPTHAFGLSRASTRASAAQQATGGIISRGTGLREWLATLPAAVPGVSAAVFDTRVDKPVWLVGSAARAAAKRLRHLGYPLVEAPQSFFVAGIPGPLLDGELSRACRWGEALSQRIARTVA
jgi:hypothetical protein